MTVKYQIPCSESDIYVLEKENAFHVTIGSKVNPLSFGNKLAEFVSLGRAVDAAEQFCKLYTLIKEYGYHLESDNFRKEGMENLSVPELLEMELTLEAMRELLERKAAVKEA
ncbi:hypothetical protein D7Z26_25130 [Cohnella endophytica]|uniref:Uncharacterized protein n=1 Tax=Cohnella endophytica TaxID=2419778 RepID=A0A494X556_9BACL|nr:hypothetical protein [Cohnella endophytica]RKP45835.1 hypothetical protein D7Z26_25130 [Cohnella endophytica]